MSQEMLPRDIFTRSRRPWVETIKLKHLLTHDEDLSPEQINTLGKQIATILEASTLFDNDEIIANFKEVDDLAEFNSIMDDMYDECNLVRIWVE